MNDLPLWLFFLVATVSTFAAIEIGHGFGSRRRRIAQHEKEGPVGSAVAAMLGLLAFLLAFTFSASASRYDVRKQILLDEVNAIGTAALRTDLLPEPHRTRARTDLREYVDILADLETILQQPDGLERAIARIRELQGRLWEVAQAVAADGRSPPIDVLFVTALNEMFDLHTKRAVVAIQYQIPLEIWLALGFVAMLAMAIIGFQFGLSGRRSRFTSLALCLTFAVVILLIQDLDSPRRGMIRVDQQPMRDLKAQFDQRPP